MRNVNWVQLKPRVIFALTLTLGVILGASSGVYIVQKQALKNGVAHYHYLTGEFCWGPMSEGIRLDGMLPDYIKKELK